MQITLNGESREVEAGTTVAQLLQQMEFEPRAVAVELNLEVVPRARHAEFTLQDKDRLEIVTFVGGG